MRYLQRLLGAFLCLLMVCFSGFAQTASDDLVSLQAKQQRLDLVLKDIARQTNKTFSYTSSTINVEQKITISITRKPLKEALDLIFENRIAYKIKGKYIILSPQSPPKDELRKITIRGYIKDKETRQNIAYASIYESSQLVASLSNQNGYFEMKLSATESPQRIALTVSKQQYWSADMRLLGNQDQFLNVNLLSQRLDSIHSVGGEIDPNKIPKEGVKIENVEVPLSEESELKQSIRRNFARIASPVADFFLSMKQKAHINNLDSTFSNPIQLSILPSLGTNQFLGGNTINDVSFNIIGGYNKGVNIMEIGGIFNIIREDARYFQMAGVSNMVGGDVYGLQAGGILNIVKGNIFGLQAGGAFNMTDGDIIGLQVSSIFNIADGDIIGLQAGGIFNIAGKDITGLQAAGLFNINKKSILGGQVAGIINLRPSELRGVQIAGLINLSKKQRGSIQLAGLLNHTHQAEGGFQIGLINIADSAHRLVPIGLLSFIKKGDGYKRIELSVDDLLNTTLSFKTGISKFYNILTVGMPFNIIEKTSYLVGYGLGTTFFEKSSWSIDINLMAYQVVQAKDTWFKSGLFKGSLGVEKKLGKRVSLAIGGGLNYWRNESGYEFERYYAKKPSLIIRESSTDTYKDMIWIGYQGGLRYIF